MVSPVLESLRHRRIPPREIELGPLTAEDPEAIIREFLHRYRKSMTDDQRAALLAKADADTPLYLLVALEELRTLGTYEEITYRIAHLPPDTRALFIWILKRLEDDDGFRDVSGRKIGRELVSRLVSLLGASRHGLSQQELVELLSPGDHQGNVAALAQLLRPYLMQRGELLDFYHGQFREAASTAYLPSESQRLAAHGQLATYFYDKADPEKNKSWKGDSSRSLLEVVFHLVGAERVDDYCQILWDLRFVEARCRVSQVFELIADYRLAQEHLPEAQADLREERARKERMRRWKEETPMYARQWRSRRARMARDETVTEPEPGFPKPMPICEMWSEKKISEECKRILKSPSRRDRLERFAAFVSRECYPLIAHGNLASFPLQHAFNMEPGGAVHDVAAAMLPTITAPHCLRHWPSRELTNPMPALLLTLVGHTGWVRSVSLTSDGGRAVTCGDKTVRVWDLTTGQCLRVLIGHSSSVQGVSVTPYGRRAVSWDEDGTLVIWNLASGRFLHVVKPRRKAHIIGVYPTFDGWRVLALHSVLRGDAEKIRVQDLVTGKCQTLAGHSECVHGAEITPDGRRAVSYSADKTLRVWDMESGQCLATLGGHTNDISSLSVTPDGRRAVSGSRDRTIRVWDLESGQCLQKLEGHTDDVRSVSMTPDGRRVVSGSWDRTLRVWDLSTGRCVRTLTEHGCRFVSVSVTYDGGRAVTLSLDKNVRVWDLTKRKSEPPSEPFHAQVTSFCVAPDRRFAFSGHIDGTLKTWSMESEQYCGVSVALNAFEHHLSEREQLEYPGLETVEIDREVGSVNVLGDGEGVIFVVNTLLGDRVRVWSQFSRIRKWRVSKMAKRGESIGSLSVMADGRRAVTCGSRGVRMWDLASGRCLRTFSREGGSLVSVTPDGWRAVSGSSVTLRVWDLESGRCLQKLEGHTDAPRSVSVTPDGRRAVSGGNDYTLRVWDLESGQCLQKLLGHTDPVNTVGVTLDGRYAVSGSDDHTLRVWDLLRSHLVLDPAHS